MVFSLGGRTTMGLVLLTAIFNGCTEGYDQSMMNNLNLVGKYTEYFDLDSNIEGLNVAIINAGSVLGGLFAGQLCDRYGRRSGVAVSAVITVVAVAIQASAVHEAAFCVGRFLLGVAITVNGTAAPVWVMEMAHPRYRGVLGGMYMANWYLAATIVSGISLGTYTFNSTWAWRGLSVGQLVPSLLSLMLLPFTPESPRWLISQDRHDEAFDLLVKIHGKGNRNDALVLAEFKEISDTLRYEKKTQSTWMGLFLPRSNFHRFGIVLALNIFGEVAGNNIVSFYVGDLLDAAGIEATRTQIVVNTIINVWNLACAVCGSFALEFLGRKRMLLGTMMIMTSCLVLLSILQPLFPAGSNQAAGYGMVAIAFILLGSYSVAWTPLTVVYPVEVLKYTQRAKGMALGQVACYAFGFVNQYTIPIAIDTIGWRYYAINAAWNVVISVIIWWVFVETNGYALEEVDKIFDDVIHKDGVFIGTGKDAVVDDVEKVVEITDEKGE